MKHFSVQLAIFGLILPLLGEEPTRVTTSGDGEAAILGNIADGTPPLPQPPPDLPDFVVKSTVVREIDVVDPPPMAGLPPIEGTITATVHLVENPGLPDPIPPPASPIVRNESQILARSATKMVFVSASVYDHARTFLRWHPNGDVSKTMSGWSNLDFNHFSGFANFQVIGDDGQLRKYSLMMQLSSTDTAQMQARFQRFGKIYQAPAHPDLPVLATHGPAFVVTEGDPDDTLATQVIADLHKLYQVEGQRMADAYAARMKANEDRRAELLAHPPVPQDVTIHFWERDHPVGLPADTIKEGGTN